MKLSRKWLNEFVQVDLGDREFAEAMTLSGSKVEITEDLGREIENVVVGRVTEMHRHENSDHMWVCSVDVGGERPLQIVTGAQNVNVDDLVPVALDHSRLPGGKEITAGSLRGILSEGMLCSLGELGLDTRDFPDAIENGIWILHEECRPGDDIRPVAGLDDHVVEFEITPNRPDCLSIIGLAREAAVTFHKPLALHTPEIRGCGGNIRDSVSITVEDGALCPRYTARLVKNVKIGPSPKWMRERLRASGVRPISNIVDITNYVMLEYGQPMHAFDFSCVEGGHIVVRTARQGEGIVTLDGTERKLTPSMLCICDEKKPVCVAGVMGGANSEIVGDTAMVLFESANFNGVSVRRTATALGMRTDASSRYEKGLDPANTVKAVQRACELVELLGCGEVVDGYIDVVSGDLSPRTVLLEPDKINALLGTDVPESDMRRILADLGFTLEGNMIGVPSWRGDVERCADIAEEVARFYGYDNIPVTPMAGSAVSGGYSERQILERDLGAACRSLGLSEILTYSFVSPSVCDKIRLPDDSPLRNMMKILNPLGEDASVMRTTILPSMLEVLARNYKNRNKTAALYEIGKLYFRREDGLAREPKVLIMGAYGDGEDFFRMKGRVEALLRALRIEDLRFEPERENPSYHPGRCAKVYTGEQYLGILGQIHPLVAKNYGLDVLPVTAELDVEALEACEVPVPQYRPLPRFPSIERDIAVVCDEKIPIASLSDCIQRGGGELLRGVKLFDIYQGSHIPAGKKSTAFNLILRAPDRTMTDAEADGVVKAVLKELEEKLGAVIR